jgi:Ca-activated chloride channel family protein
LAGASALICAAAAAIANYTFDIQVTDMKRSYGAIVLTTTFVACAGVLSGRPALQAQETRATFRTSVALVPISAVVRDSRNRIVRDLSKKDFHVLENSQPRRILEFKADDEAPVSLAVLLDTSGSMRGRNWSRGKAVVDELLKWVNRPSDELALFTFDKALRQETAFTNDAESIRRALQDVDAWGLTSLYDAVAETAKRLADRRGQRRAVIVITDGADTSSTLSAPEVSSLASSIDVPVYAIAVEPAIAPREHARSREDALADLAYWTGGDVSHVAASDAPRTIALLMAELRQQYFLAIEADPTSGWHRIDVTTRRRGLTVRARGGYFTAGSGRVDSGQ